MTTLAPGVELRTYRVEAALGGGGHALTWRATDTRSGRAVVIKQFRLADAPDWKGHALFLRECAVLRSLAHPAIPAYVDAFEEATGADNGVPELFLVQEFVDAPNLAALLGEGRRWSEEALVDLARQALSILDWLHTRHPPVIHRDLKPSNLLLRPPPDDDPGAPGSLALIDFTAVTAAVAVDEQGSTIVGTHGYMPPEQLLGHAVPASDLYALGMTLVHVASGQHPSSLPLDGLRRDVSRAVRLSPPVQAWLERLVEPDPTRRPTSAAAARHELDRALVPRPSVVAQLGRPRFSRTHPAFAALLAVVVAVAVVVVATARSERDDIPPAPAVAPRVPAASPAPPDPPQFRDVSVEVKAPASLLVEVRAARLRTGSRMYSEPSSLHVGFVVENKGPARLGEIRLRITLFGAATRTTARRDVVSQLHVPLEAEESRFENVTVDDVPRSVNSVLLEFEADPAADDVPPPIPANAVFAPPVFMPDETSLGLVERRAFAIAEGLSTPMRAFDVALTLSGVARLSSVTLVPTCLDAAGAPLPRRNDRDFVVLTHTLDIPSLHDHDVNTFRALCPEEAAAITWRVNDVRLTR